MKVSKETAQHVKKSVLSTKTKTALVKIAQMKSAGLGDSYGVEVDESVKDADFSPTNRGCWVRAWLWVSADELKTYKKSGRI